jgi:ribosome-binding protein aMBF1 (putative translation factor)
MKTLEYLDAAKAKLGIASDYALAKKLNMTTTAISNYRVGRSRMDDDVALKVAKILEIDPLEVIAAANVERSKTPEIKALWMGVMEKFSMGFNALISAAKPRRGSFSGT